MDTLKSDLQGRIKTHTSLADQPNQSETVLQGSLGEIHTLRDQLKAANEKLKELKKGVKDTQDKLRVRQLLYFCKLVSEILINLLKLDCCLSNYRFSITVGTPRYPFFNSNIFEMICCVFKLLHGWRQEPKG